MNLTLILPVGTQIVSLIDVKDSSQQLICPQGAVGVIVQAPTDNSHAYRVRLPNHLEVMLNRQEFSIRRQFQAGHFRDDLLADYNLQDCIIYRCIIGSRAYGLENEKSDTDRRGIYLPPAELHWSLYGIPEQIENKVEQECYWELQKFILLALKAHPNVLECLYTPLVETASPLALELLEKRSLFLSKLIDQTYNSYVLSQFKKMEQDLRNKGHIRPKHTLHLIRLLLSGITILKEGFVPVRVDDY
jgi:hypothetical protein